MVRNDYIREYAALAHREAEAARAQRSGVANKYIRVEDCNHTTVCFYEPAVKLVITETVNFFNKLISERNE